jgi:hypothetical protein
MAIRGRYGESSRPATLGSTLAAHLCLIVWCKACRHQVGPDVAEQVERYGPDLSLPEWAVRLVCCRRSAASCVRPKDPQHGRFDLWEIAV